MLEKNTALWIEELIEANDQIMIFHNSNIDADGISSAYSLAKLIKTNYPKKDIKIMTRTSDFVEKLSYLGEKYDWEEFVPEIEEVQLNDAGEPVPQAPKKKEQLGLIIGASIEDRVELFDSYKEELKKIVLINHLDNLVKIEEVSLNWTDTTYTTTSSMIEQLAKTLEWKVNKEIAYLLMHGLLAGTQRFSITNGNRTSFDSIINLLDIVGEKAYEEIIVLMKSRTKKQLELEKYMLDNVVIKGGVAYVAIDAATLESMKINNYFFEEVELIGYIEEANYWLTFIETERGTEMEIRSRAAEFRADYTAKEFGGDGTKTKGSALLEKFSEHKEVLKFLNRQIKTKK